MNEGIEPIEVEVAAVVADPNSELPIVILKSRVEESALPIWIGAPEGAAIASGLQKINFPRPMTHDLLRRSIEELGGVVTRAEITGIEEQTFRAELEILVGQRTFRLDARPSDAIALAVRVGCPLFVAAEIFGAGKVAIVEQNHWAGVLDGLDPDDFKYKM